jgi:negative regulator of sigma E activity
MSSKKSKNNSNNASRDETLHESLSAFMDGEASEFEYHRLLRECSSDGHLKQKWSRYHLLSAHLRGEIHQGSASFRARANSSSQAGRDLLARIHNQLAEEGVPGFTAAAQKIIPQQSTSAGPVAGKQQIQAELRESTLIWKIGQGAIAASVALAVIISSQFFDQSIPQSATNQIAEQIQAPVPEFNDNYAPTEFNRIPSLNAEMAGIEDFNEAARDRLRRAVYQEFVGEPQQQIEIPVNFSVTRENQQ